MSSSWTFTSGFSGAYDSLKTILRKALLLQALLLLALCLSACGDSQRTQSGPSPPGNGSAAATSQPSLTPLIAPPGTDDRPLLPGSLGRPITADGLPALQPAKGINVSVDTLFAEEIKDPIERSKRLETAVVEMRRDLDAAMPAIKRLVAIEKDIQLLSSQLEILLNGEPPPAEEAMVLPVAPVASVAPVPLTPAIPESQTLPPDVPEITAGPAPPPSAPPPILLESVIEKTPPGITPPPAPAMASTPPTPATSSQTLAVTGLRLGESPGKTRLVFDMTGSATYRTDLDNAEKILIVEIEKASWSAAQQALSSPLIQSYTTQPLDGNGGTRVIILLKKPASIASESLLPPETPGNPTRLVIDLAH